MSECDTFCSKYLQKENTGFSEPECNNFSDPFIQKKKICEFKWKRRFTYGFYADPRTIEPNAKPNQINTSKEAL